MSNSQKDENYQKRERFIEHRKEEQKWAGQQDQHPYTRPQIIKGKIVIEPTPIVFPDKPKQKKRQGDKPTVIIYQGLPAWFVVFLMAVIVVLVVLILVLINRGF